jgi:misacylated tRNA(Ala) deacylase
MTELAYLATGDAAYVREFEAHVRALPPGAVVLDRTFFYPAGGGQPADRGSIARLGSEGGWKVTDVTRSGAAVLHRISRGNPPGEVLRVGDAVRGEVDWERRYRHMRAHSGQHLLSARLWERLGRRTVRARLTETGGTLVLEPGPRSLDLPAFEQEVNELLRTDRPVQVRFVSRTDYERSPASRSSLVPLPAGLATIRVIEIEAADRCPCGGTHVRRLGEVGRLEITAAVPEPDGSLRVSFRISDAGTPTPSG